MWQKIYTEAHIINKIYTAFYTRTQIGVENEIVTLRPLVQIYLK